MPHHLTIEQIATLRESSPQEVLTLCHRLGVPIIHGRIDRTLLELAEQNESATHLSQITPESPRLSAS